VTPMTDEIRLKIDGRMECQNRHNFFSYLD